MPSNQSYVTYNPTCKVEEFLWWQLQRATLLHCWQKCLFFIPFIIILARFHAFLCLYARSPARTSAFTHHKRGITLFFFSSGWSDWSCCGCTLPVFFFLNGVDGSSAKTSSSKHMDWKLLFFKGQFPHCRFNPPKKMGVGQVQAFFAAIFF